MKLLEEYLNISDTKKWVSMACPMCGGEDRFVVNTHTQKWLCRNCSPFGKKGVRVYQDIIALVMADKKVGFHDACKILGEEKFGASVATYKREFAVKPIPSRSWQEEVTPVIDRCHAMLIGSTHAKSYLASRGITEELANKFNLGYSASWQKVQIKGECSAWIPKGIVIPRYDDQGVLVNVNCRVEWRQSDMDRAISRALAKGNPADSVRLPKYISVLGGLVNSALVSSAIRYAQCTIVVEGEFDAILLSGYVPDECSVVTLGSSGYVPTDETIRELQKTRLYLCFDSDDKGRIATDRWREMFPRAKPISLPAGKDVTEYWQQKGDLRMWVAEEIGC